VLWKQVTLVGVGLLGGSIGLALKQRRLARRVVGLVRREASLAECQRLGIADEITLDTAAAVRGADLVILGTPVLQMRALAKQIAPHLRRGAIVTDVGSVKGRLVADLEPLLAKAGAHFVGSHPMAGGEQMGPSAARADLFKGAVCVVTPTPHSPAAAVRKILAFWQELGGRTLKLAPDFHDQLTAHSSHLPHVAASTLARLVLDPAAPGEQAGLCATGFRDTTRVASGSPEMWRDIVLENRGELLPAVAALRKELQKFERLARKGDPGALLDFFAVAKQRRDAWLAALAAGTSPSLE
jgi:prephenate dehydrogenase